MGSACCASKEVPVVIQPKPAVTKPRSPPMSRENSAMQRFNKVDITTTNRLKLIDGFMNEPLVSLEEALMPFEGKIDRLSHHIHEAKTKCHYPNEHNLTRDESAAIHIYTMKWPEGSLYDHLQAAWSSENRSTLKPWFKYLKLFKTALDKLPNAKSEIWQGTAFSEGLNDKLYSKSTPLYSTLSSCSPSMNEIKDHLGKHPGSKMILIGYKAVDGKDVTGYTAGHSKEYMVFPGMKMGVANYVIVDDKGSVITHLMGVIDRPEPIKVVTPQPEKHFKCCNKTCGYRCRGNHNAKHCYGFAAIAHSCQHHCGPPLTCFNCEKNISHLHECNKCQGHFCEKCCFK